MTKKMVTIELTEKAYRELLWFKNFNTRKLRGITNPEVIRKFKLDSKKQPVEVNVRLMRKAELEMDFEPRYTFSQCISDTIESVMDEQKTGNVNFIT